MPIQLTGCTIEGALIQSSVSPGVILTGLQLYLDAAISASYSGSGVTWYDLSGNSNDVTMQNSGSISYTNTGGGYFNTGGDGWFINESTTNLPLGNSNYTLSVWVQLGSEWGAQGMISIGPFGSGNEANAFRTSGTNGYLNYWWANDLFASSALSPETQWFNAVAIFDGTTRSIWINGVQYGSDTPEGHDVTSSALQVAKTVSGEYLQGNIGQALIYDRALTSEEINYNYNLIRTRYGV
jgi:hypothetical protein